MFQASAAFSWHDAPESPLFTFDRDTAAGQSLVISGFAQSRPQFGLELNGHAFGGAETPNPMQRFSATVASVSGPSQDADLVFVDQSVAGWNELVADLQRQQSAGRSLEVVLLDSQRDGVQQIAEALDGHLNVRSVHVVGHGTQGQLNLGNAVLSNQTLPEHASALESWGSSLAIGADILFYGCNLGGTSEGRSLVESIGKLTGADVAASTDRTGSAFMAGDWELEFQWGDVSNRVVFSASLQERWDYVLDVNIDQAWLNANGPGPYYLDQAGETYILQTDVTTDGTAFAIIADDVTFDLNGHTITYDDSTPVTVFNGSFEQGNGGNADGWDFSAAPNADRYNGIWLQNEVYDGDHSLRFLANGQAESVVSNSTVTLEANTMYSLSSMFMHEDSSPAAELYVKLDSTTGGTDYEVAWNGSNWRGIQLVEEEFTTTSGGTYNVTVGIRGGANNGGNYSFVDDLKIQRTKTYGIAVSAMSWAPQHYPGITQFGIADRAVVQNGSIVQGSDQATWGHGFFVRQANDITISNVSVTVGGANASTIYWYSGSDGTVDNSDLTSDVRTITSRDRNDGAVVHGFQGIFKNTRIHNGPGVGLYLADTAASEVFGNTIKLKTKYTNAFAIFAKGPGTRVYNNLIDNAAGEYNSRGIFIRGNQGYRYVYDNTIKVQGLINNQEYQGAQGSGVYGIQLESDSNAEVYGNTVYVNAELVQGYAFRANGTTSGITVHDNTFEVFSNGSYGAVFKFEGQTQSGLSIHDNTLITNNGLFGDTINSTVSVYRSNLTISNPVTNSRLFEGGYYASSNFHSTVNLVDTVFANSATRDAVNDAHFLYYANGNPENRAAFTVGWSTTVDVQDLGGDGIPGAAVSVVDQNGDPTYSGTTDQNGQAVVDAMQFRTQGNVKTPYGPYTVTVTALGETEQAQFTPDQQQTVSLQFDVDLPTLTYVGTKLIVDDLGGDNQIIWSASSPLQFSLDGQSMSVIGGTTEIEFRGGAGNDSVVLTGSSGDDSLILTDGDTNFTTTVMQIRTLDMENTDVSGGGGNDRAYLHGSALNDQFDLSRTSADVSNTQWTYDSSGFEHVVAFDTAGMDSVTFTDTAGDELFRTHHDYSVMTSGPVYLRANGLESVLALSTAGGFDSAYLYDSPSLDNLTTDTLMARLSGGGSTREVRSFERTYTTSSLGGNDVATMTGSSSRDTVVGSANAPTFRGPGFSHQVSGFYHVTINGGAGNNALYLDDTSANDAFQLSDSQFQWNWAGRQVIANGFDTQVVRDEQGGYDSVQISDTSGNDSFIGSSAQSELIAGPVRLKAVGMENVTVSSVGGSDSATITGDTGNDVVSLTPDRATISGSWGRLEANDFSRTETYLNSQEADAVSLVGTGGDDTLSGDLGWLRLVGNGYSNYVNGFDTAEVYGLSGSDSLYLADSVLNDVAVVRHLYSRLANSQSTIRMHGFETQIFRSDQGGQDSVTFYDSGLNDTLYSIATFSSMKNQQTYHRAVGFSSVSAYSTHAAGVNDTVSIYGTVNIENVSLFQDRGSYTGSSLTRYFEGFDFVDVYLDLSTDTHDETDVWYQYQLIDT